MFHDMNRKHGALTSIETKILLTAIELLSRGIGEFYGYQLAGSLAERERAKRLIGYGTLYKALDRLENAGLLAGQWEDPVLAAESKRPRRRMFHITADGERALRVWESSQSSLAATGQSA
jgi:PadR family transcriptional regulator PadR